MSFAVKKGRSVTGRSKFFRLFWTIFPHFCLIGSLVAYAALGALVFQQIEGKAASNKRSEEYNAFLKKLVETVNKSMANPSYTQEHVMKEVATKIKDDFKSIWLQHPVRWSFFGSLFFCCTVFTTVGYGEIYPVTLSGKLVCILYAMVGIPLMLLVITDVGDILAVLLSKAYLRLHRLCRLPTLCWPFRRCRKKGVEGGVIPGGTYTFSQDLVIQEPMEIKQVLRSQASVKRKSLQLCNMEIFDRIIARENLARGPLLRSLSCPELNQIKPPKGVVVWDFTGIGEKLDNLDVPITLILVVVFAYILFIGLILPLWETEINSFDAIYFCFITLTTIGFGDIVPNHPNFFMVTFVFIITGMAIMSMAFKLSQSRFVSCYRQYIRFISRGMAGEHKLTE